MPHFFHSRKIWSQVSVHFGVDVALWICAFVAGTFLRFSGSSFSAIGKCVVYFPGFAIGALSLASACYISGLYSRHAIHQSVRRRYLLVLGCLALAIVATLSYGSINFSARIGRGVMGLALPAAILLTYLHHGWLTNNVKRSKERLISIIGSQDDELEVRLLLKIPQIYTEVVGCVVANGYRVTSDIKILGKVDDLNSIVESKNIDVIFCTLGNLRDKKLAAKIRHQRYAGVSGTSLVNLCEEVFQAVPIEVIDEDWLMNACSTSGFYYAAKLKRAFDVIAALTFMVILGPFLLIGMALVFIRSGRPVFYSQIRAGKFGRDIKITKLRTMDTNAEVDGAQWSQNNDPRVTPIGATLRKFRIDEIPQLWSVLIGDMSFVGPRPERPEFIDDLSDEVYCYKERLLVQPGLTGWAQVNYPYGADIDDVRRKLEFDLYYMKHMSLVLDIFILLDTIKIIIRGGASRQRGARLTQFELHLHDNAKQLNIPRRKISRLRDTATVSLSGKVSSGHRQG